MKTFKIRPPKKSPKRGIPINELIKKYINKIMRDAIIPKIVLIIVNFLYNFTLYLFYNRILIIIKLLSSYYLITYECKNSPLFVRIKK